MMSKDDPFAGAPRGTKPEVHVYECCVCHKVFEADKPSPRCTECESDDVEELG